MMFCNAWIYVVVQVVHYFAKSISWCSWRHVKLPLRKTLNPKTLISQHLKS